MKRVKNIIFFAILVFLIILSSLSCYTSVHNSPKNILLRDSFVKINKSFEVSVCTSGFACTKLAGFGSTASGSIIKNRFDGSYVLTAAHVCDDSQMKQFVEHYFSELDVDKKYTFEYSLSFDVITIENKEYSVKIAARDNDNDICLLWVDGCFKQALALSPKAPVPGDRSYNMAAPLGIFAKNMIPLQEGLFNGSHKNKAFYSIPAIGGSSGSPILNHKGELIGMIHSTYKAFNHISISPTHDDLTSFIEKELEKHISLHMIDIYMRTLMGVKDSLEKEQD